MNQSLMELVFILDRSGSMGGKEADTIGGFNSLISKQKLEEGDAAVTVVLFDDKYEMLYDRIPLKDVPEMTSKDYYVRGCTALLDAVGKTVNSVKGAQDGMDEEKKPGKTLFVIMTDGMENASSEYKADAVKALVKERKESGWEFLFIGADIDSVSEASRIGIDAKRAATVDSSVTGSGAVFEAVANVVTKARRSRGKLSESIEDDWSKDIES